MYKIEKNIPVPNKIKKSKYPLLQMQIGDSFFIECEENKIHGIRSTVCYYAKKINTENNLKMIFKSSAIENGIRFWRVE